MPLIPLAPYKTPRKAAQARNHQVAALMAPTNGLNLRDPFLLLKPEDALTLNNFVALPQGCSTRAGYRKFATGLGGSVNSLLGYLAQDPLDNRLFAAVENQFFDVTSQVENPSPDVADNNSVDGRWSSIMFSGATLNYLCCTSPSGGYWTYDSTNGWHDRTIHINSFSGNFGPIGAWKNRLFIIAAGTAKCYYLDVNALQGPAHELDLGPLMKHGGHLVAVVNWTMNAGIDIDDYLVFFGSQGDVIVYSGTDPDNANTFALRGIWYMSRPPIGDRFFHEYGGELFVLTEMGLLPLTKIVNGEIANTYNIISARIQPALSPQLVAYLDIEGWEVGLSDDNSLFIVKPPEVNEGVYQQWVMNIQTGAWSTFTGMPMITWVTFNGQMYFGTDDGEVCLGLVGDLDGVEIDGTGGEDVFSTVQGGYSDLGAPANLKIFSMARPIFVAELAPSVSLQINIDYQPNAVYSQPTYFNQNAPVWDQSYWDNAVWISAADSFAAWAGVQGLGYYGSLKMAVKGKAGTRYISSTLMYQTGGVM